MSYNPNGGGGSGTVTDVSVATANGFAGTVASPSIAPIITVKTTVTGLMKGDGTAVSAASAGTDYQAVLVSGTNIKTINGETLLAAGDIVITGGSGNSYNPGGW